MIEDVLDVIEAGGLRRIRWASDQAIGFDTVEEGWQIREWFDAVLDLHYVELALPYRGPVDIKFDEWPKMRKMLAWAILEDRVSQCIQEGAAEYSRLAGRWPGVAYIKTLPKGIADGVEVEGVLLVECEWALTGFLFIGG